MPPHPHSAWTEVDGVHVPGSVMHCELLGTMTSKSARDAPANISLGLDHIHVCHEGHYCASFCLSQALMGDRHSRNFVLPAFSPRITTV